MEKLNKAARETSMQVVVKCRHGEKWLEKRNITKDINTVKLKVLVTMVITLSLC